MCLEAFHIRIITDTDITFPNNDKHSVKALPSVSPTLMPTWFAHLNNAKWSLKGVTQPS